MLSSSLEKDISAMVLMVEEEESSFPKMLWVVFHWSYINGTNINKEQFAHASINMLI